MERHKRAPFTFRSLCFSSSRFTILSREFPIPKERETLVDLTFALDGDGEGANYTAYSYYLLPSDNLFLGVAPCILENCFLSGSENTTFF